MAINHWNALDLFSQLLRRDLQSRHRGAVPGFGAMVVNQLVMLALYVLVFGFVFRGPYGVLPDESGLDYALGLFVALLVPLFLFNLGILWFVSALGVFARDLQLLIGPVNQVLMFGSAAFYSLKNMPEPFAAILQWNPFARLFQMAREAVLAGRTPDLLALSVISVASLLFCWVAYTSFHHLKAAFADVL